LKACWGYQFLKPAQNHLLSKLTQLLLWEKIIFLNLGDFGHFQKIAQRKHSPNGRNFAQSGHPGRHAP
jgi:hypothetical protein